MQRIPVEIWGQIFIELLSSSISEDRQYATILCCPRNILDESNSCAEDMEHIRVRDCLREQRQTLIRITHVSTSWFEAAIGCPILWTNIYATPDTGQLITRSWLKRSKNLPLNMVVDLRRYLNPSDDTHPLATGNPQMVIRRIMQTLIPHMTRCKQLSISTSVDVDMGTVLWTLQRIRTTPLLEHLRLCQSEEGPDIDSILDTMTPYPVFHGNAPLLRDLRLNGVPMTHMLQVAIGITTLTIRCIAGKSLRWSYVMQVLRHSPQLQTLSMWDSIVFDLPVRTDSDLRDQLMLPNLTTISIGNMDIPFTTALFALLDVPVLHTLCLDYDGRDCEILGIQLYSRRPGNHSIISNLTDLHMAGLAVSPITGTKIARQMHRVIDLDIYDAPWIFRGLLDETVQDFKESRALIAPHLISISLNGIDILSLTIFVMLRKTLQAPLITLCIPRDNFQVPRQSEYLTRFVAVVNLIDVE